MHYYLQNHLKHTLLHENFAVSRSSSKKCIWSSTAKLKCREKSIFSQKTKSKLFWVLREIKFAIQTFSSKQRLNLLSV